MIKEILYVRFLMLALIPASAKLLCYMISYGKLFITKIQANNSILANNRIIARRQQ